jgi:response regulator of citrate/malate metabolism
MEKTTKKTSFATSIEIEIFKKLHLFLEKHTKAELILMNKKEIAEKIGVSVITLDKYLKMLING